MELNSTMPPVPMYNDDGRGSVAQTSVLAYDDVVFLSTVNSFFVFSILSANSCGE